MTETGSVDAGAGTRTPITLIHASPITALITLTDGVSDVALPPVVVPAFPPGYSTVLQAIVILAFRKISNSAAVVNAIDGNQNVRVQKGGGAFVACLVLPDHSLNCPATSENPGDALVSNQNLSATITAPDTYGFEIHDNLVHADWLFLHDVQVLIKLVLI